MTQFKIGDRVRIGKLEGEVIAVSNDPADPFPVNVEWDEGGGIYFTRNGKLNGAHKTPVLELISRPKRTVKREGWMQVRLYAGRTIFVHNEVFKTKKEAAEDSVKSECPVSSKLIGFQKVEWEEEIEE